MLSHLKTAAKPTLYLRTISLVDTRSIKRHIFLFSPFCSILSILMGEEHHSQKCNRTRRWMGTFVANNWGKGGIRKDTDQQEFRSITPLRSVPYTHTCTHTHTNVHTHTQTHMYTDRKTRAGMQTYTDAYTQTISTAAQLPAPPWGIKKDSDWSPAPPQTLWVSAPGL